MNQTAMKRLRGALLTVLLAGPWPRGAVAAESALRALAPGKAATVEIARGERHAYRIDLAAGDYVSVQVDQRGIDVAVDVLDPNQEKIQEFDSPTGPKGVELAAVLARSAGTYTFEIRSLDEGPTSGSYEIGIKELLHPAERIGYRMPLLSPRLTALRERIATDSTALDHFWKEVAQEGAPLVEPLAGDDARVLVTYLWRGDARTVNAYVFSDLERTVPESRMERLPKTDIFYRSIRVPRDARFTYTLSPDDSEVPMSLINWDDIGQGTKRTITFRPDPLNPHRFPDEPGVPDVFVSSYVELPGARAQDWWKKRPEVPAGQVTQQVYRSESLGNSRLVQVYTPPGYDPNGAPYDLLILFGGRSYAVEVPAPTILDTLLAEKRIRPVVAVLVANPGLHARNQELSCSQPFVDFLTGELMPWIRKSYRVTSDPHHTTLVGFSLGGLTAAYAAFRRPDVFGNVISQSGSFWWRPQGDPEDEWLTRQIAAGAKLPVRFYLEVGNLENGPKTDSPSNLVTNRHLRDVLLAKGYDVTYREFSGDHQSTSWRETLADGIQVFLGVER